MTEETKAEESAAWSKLGSRLLWVLLLVPGIGQLVLLCSAMFRRWSFSYDLEWMEGGLLTHAKRVADGVGIYGDPSVDFIPFLYTPLYPGLLALLEPFVGISYGVGRGISILATLALCYLLTVIVRREVKDSHWQDSRLISADRLAWIGGMCAIGFFSATYPWVEGWFDLVRADSLFMLMVVFGLYGVRIWARAEDRTGQRKLAFAISLLALSFFAKQTGILFVATGGFMILALNWRKVPLYIGVAGSIGLGGTWILNQATNGWFWIYVYKTHQHHDFNMDRFYKSFGNMLWHWPAMTGVIAFALILAIVTLLVRRSLPGPARGLAIWFPVFCVSVLVGAVGWGTEFAHFNAYIPAMVFGALCAGLSILSIASCLQSLLKIDKNSGIARRVPGVSGILLALVLGAQLLMSWWKPGIFVPNEKEHRAGSELIALLRNIEGEILIPYHPWYAHLAGKETQVHLMGLRDMSTGKVWPIRGLRDKLENQRYGAIIMDNRPIGRELSRIHRHYRLDDYLPRSASPHVFTGAGAVWNRSVATLIPRAIWVPNTVTPPPAGARVLWDFEEGKFAEWTPGGKGGKRPGGAWGSRPVSRPLPKQGPVLRFGGRYYLSSFHGGDKSLGTLRSPFFVLTGQKITFRLSGGNSKDLRAELRIAGEVVASATGNNSERMADITWDISQHKGKNAEIVLIDDFAGSWGHLNADEFLVWD